MSDTAKPADAIFQAGVDARAKGEPATACPHPDASGEREQWLAGWHKPDDIDDPPEIGFA